MQTNQFGKISVIGLGYIGLPTAAILAASDTEVVGVDVDHKVVKTVNEGRIHIVEPGLEELVYERVTAGKLRAVIEPEEADVFIIAVPTPVIGRSHDADLSYVKAAALKIAKVVKSGDLIVLESTSPVGTTEQLVQWLQAERSDLRFPNSQSEAMDVNVAYCPERVLPGNVLYELKHNDRIIGGITDECARKAVAVYGKFVTAKCIVASTARVAEMVKLTENSYRDVNIAFANELSLICDEFKINVWELIRLSNKHPRVDILKPGAGVGGHCIAVDPWFIINSAPETAKLIKMARNINDCKPDWVIKSIKALLGEYLSKYTQIKISEISIAFYGIAFKPDIDDLRESPALRIATDFVKNFPGDVIIVEPNIKKLPEILETATLMEYEIAQKNANIHVFLVAHKEFIISDISNLEYKIDVVGLTSK